VCRCIALRCHCRFVTFRLRFVSHCRSFASNFEQVANLLCAQANSASYSRRDDKWVVAYRLPGESLYVADWGGGMFASCKPWVQLLAYAGNGWPHSALRYHQLMAISCHLAGDCKALLVVSLSHLRSAIANTKRLLPFPFTWYVCASCSGQGRWPAMSHDSEVKVIVKVKVKVKAEVVGSCRSWTTGI